MLVLENTYNSSRSGNIFFFILNCISDNLLYYKHEQISLKYVKNNFIIFKDIPEILFFPEFSGNCNNNTIITDLFVYPKVIVDSYKEIIDKYIKPYIDCNTINNFNINFETDLIIHIRSGDVFSKDFIKYKEMFDCFVSPPYSFYKEIIETHNFDKIYILSENYNLNPVIDKILKNFKNAKFLSNDLCTDFKILLNAKFFIPGHSDLSRMVLELSVSKDIFKIRENKIYYDYSKYYNININSYDEYINLILNWEI